MWIGSTKNNVNTVENISWKLGIDASVNILGVKFSNKHSASVIDENWEKKIDKCENIIKSWKYRNVDIIGKITLVKSLLASQFNYLMQAFICPEKYLDRLNTLFFKFIWSKGVIWREKDLKTKVYEKVKRRIMFCDFDDGGLNMINVRHMHKAMMIKWVSKLLKAGNCAWKIIPEYYLNTLGKDFSVFKSNINFDKLRGITKSFPTFYVKLIEICLNSKTVENVAFTNQVLWNNDLFKYHGNVLFCKRWIDKGVIYVNDILEEGKLMSFENVLKIVPNDQISMLEYNVVSNAIRKYLPMQTEINCTKVSDIYTMTSQQFRRFLLEKELKETRLLLNKRWVKKYGDIALESWTWLNAKMCTKEIRLIMLHWKILQNIYPTRILL